LVVHEFVCADCESDVFSFGGPTVQTRCASCATIREIKARDPMTSEAEAALREILGCVIPVRKGASGKPTIYIPPEEP
jgi:hypothetical protein